MFDFKIKVYYYSIKTCLYLKHDLQNEKLLYLLLPYFIMRWILLAGYECCIGCFLIARKIVKEKKIKFANEIAIVAIAKNEGCYMKEWIEYHKLCGVNKFYIYDNESMDDTNLILQPYIDKGLVVYQYYPGKRRQLDAYNDAIKRHRNECRYMAFIDLDEFIMPIKDTVSFLPDIISRILSQKVGASGVGINWCLYGSSGKEKQESGLVMERFVRRGDNMHWGNAHIKTICNPRMVKFYISPHFPQYKLGAFTINENGKRLYAWYNHLHTEWSILRINHYYCKSREEYIKKRARGKAFRDDLYDMSWFEKYNLNDIIDDAMLPYSKQVLEKL
jgi:hypothetical protein